MLRLFIGLTFNSGYTRRLCTLMEGVSGVHWQPAENLHLTVRFLGDVSLDDAEDLDAELARIAAPAWALPLTPMQFKSSSRISTPTDSGYCTLQSPSRYQKRAARETRAASSLPDQAAVLAGCAWH